MFEDPSDLRIIDGVLALGQAFGLRVVAEGVETLHHAELLLRLGAQAAQGYGIARPMPTDQWAAWAAAWQPPASWLRWRMLAQSPWSRILARLEIEHRAALTELATRRTRPVLAHDCPFHALMIDTLPQAAHQWPEYAALQQAHEAFHVTARQWWEHAPDTDPKEDPGIQQTHGALLEALHRLLERLCATAA